MSIDPRDRQRILEIAREVRRHVPRMGAYCLPEGLCGEASLALSVRLTRAGISHEILGGRWAGPISLEGIDPRYEEGVRLHAWIRFPQYDGAILDVTADQYDRAVPPVWFPAKKEWYEPLEEFHPEDIFEAAEGRKAAGKLGKSTIPLSGPRFRRPFKEAKVRVREHLKHPPRSCLCHKSKAVDRARKSLVRRLK